eukprot:symbB.v1.2.000845.t1/scaffold37.1/size397765/17
MANMAKCGSSQGQTTAIAWTCLAIFVSAIGCATVGRDCEVDGSYSDAAREAFQVTLMMACAALVSQISNGGLKRL